MDADLYEIHELVSFGGDARQAGATPPPSSAMAAPAVYEQSNDELVGLGLSSEGTSLRSGIDVAVLTRVASQFRAKGQRKASDAPADRKSPPMQRELSLLSAAVKRSQAAPRSDYR